MRGDLAYTHEKYMKGLDTLATNQGDLRSRLYDAYVSSIIHATPLKPGLGPDIDEDLAERVEAVSARFSGGTVDHGNGTVEVTVNSFTDDEAKEIAEEIFHLTRDLDRAYQATFTS